MDLMETLDAQQVMNATELTPDETSVDMGTSDNFAQIRLTRQKSRDSAVELLQETIAFDQDESTASAAVMSLDSIVGEALSEAQVESLVIAKGYDDCVVYMNDEHINVAVAAPENGLTESDVALISDLVTSQTDYGMEDIRIIEVK